MSEIARWQNQSISNAIQQLGTAKEADRVVQILNDALERCKKRFTTVENQGGCAIRLSGDFVDEDDRGFNRTHRFNFYKTVCGRIHNYANAHIRHIGPSVSQEITAELRARRGKFRNEAGAQLDSLRYVHGGGGGRGELGAYIWEQITGKLRKKR